MGNEGCRVPGCNRKHRAKGFCVKHYNQKRWERIKAQLKELERIKKREKLRQAIE